MAQKILIVIIILFASSCSHKRPGKLLPKEIMVPVLVDIHLAEAKNSSGSPFAKNNSIKIISDYGKIFNKYNIEPDDFYTSFNYYRVHPAEMDSLYEKVINELTKRQSEASKKATDEKKTNNADTSKASKPKMPNGEP